MNVNQLISEYLRDQDIVEKSRQVYGYTLNYFFRWIIIQGKDAQNVTRADIIEYKQFLNTRYKSHTRGLYTSVVKSFYKYLSRKYPGRYENIGEGIKTIQRMYDYTKDPLTIEEIRTLFASIPKDHKKVCQASLIDKRDYAILTLLYYNGLRVIEVSRLLHSDLNFQRNEIWIRGKGKSVQSVIAINSTALEAIQEYIREKTWFTPPGSNDPVFLSHSYRSFFSGSVLPSDRISSIISARMRAAGVKTERVSAHSLRHSAAVHMIIDGGFDIYSVQLFLRHADIRKTRIYTRYAERVKLQNNQPTTFLERLFQSHENSTTA